MTWTECSAELWTACSAKFGIFAAYFPRTRNLIELILIWTGLDVCSKRMSYRFSFWDFVAQVIFTQPKLGVRLVALCVVFDWRFCFFWLMRGLASVDEAWKNRFIFMVAVRFLNQILWPRAGRCAHYMKADQIKNRWFENPLKIARCKFESQSNRKPKILESTKNWKNEKLKVFEFVNRN